MSRQYRIPSVTSPNEADPPPRSRETDRPVTADRRAVRGAYQWMSLRLTSVITLTLPLLSVTRNETVLLASTCRGPVYRFHTEAPCLFFCVEYSILATPLSSSLAVTII